MTKIEELKAKRAELDKKIDSATRAAKAKTILAEATAKAHLKNALGGWCLAFLYDKNEDQSFKQLMLSSVENSVTKQPENLARIKLEALKNASGM